VKPAPGRFSIVTGWPKALASLSPIILAIKSGGPAGLLGAMILIGFSA
jgi:hypothetical protein